MTVGPLVASWGPDNRRPGARRRERARPGGLARPTRYSRTSAGRSRPGGRGSRPTAHRRPLQHDHVHRVSGRGVQRYTPYRVWNRRSRRGRFTLAREGSSSLERPPPSGLRQRRRRRGGPGTSVARLPRSRWAVTSCSSAPDVRCRSALGIGVAVAQRRVGCREATPGLSSDPSEGVGACLSHVALRYCSDFLTVSITPARLSCATGATP